MTKLAFLLALVFSPLAAAIAFIITSAEYSKPLADKKRVLRKSLGISVVTLAFLLTVPPLLILLFL